MEAVATTIHRAFTFSDGLTMPVTAANATAARSDSAGSAIFLNMPYYISISGPPVNALSFWGVGDKINAVKTLGSTRVFVISLVTLIVFGLLLSIFHKPKPPPVKIGILFSLTGNMAKTEQPLVDAALLAVEEINQAGGLRGASLAPVVADGGSDWSQFAREAERLITEEKVSAIIGCWTSACRKAVKPVVERHNHLLLYPLQYEGMEESKNIIYLGAAPNQQIVPGLVWAMQNHGKRIFLVGSDYVFPRVANMIIKEIALAQGAVILGETYLPLGGTEAREVAAEIERKKPDVVLNTINGTTNFHFFKALKERGLAASSTPVFSFSLAEPDIAGYPYLITGHYAVWSYFQSLKSEKNAEFVAKFKKKYGAGRVIGDPMEAAYIGVRLWANAVEEAKSAAPEKVNMQILHGTLNSPQGIVSVDGESRHLWRSVGIGKGRADGQFDVVWSSTTTIKPSPFPEFHPKSRWLALTAAALK